MPKLTDLQAVLLTHAAGRDDGSVQTLPSSLTAEPARVMTAISQLIRRQLVEERAVSRSVEPHRTAGDRCYGAFITAAGLAAIGVAGEPEQAEAADTPAPSAAAELAPAAPADAARQTKAALVLELLRREQGATLADLVAATGWLPHTTRAALTGLRKKGHAVERSRVDGVSTYRLGGAA